MKSTTRTFKLKVKDEPTMGEFLSVLDVLGIREKEFIKDPEKSLAGVRDLEAAECQKLLDIILEEPVDYREQPADIAQYNAAVAVDFFLYNHLYNTVKREIAQTDITKLMVTLPGMGKVASILALSVISQGMNPQTTKQS